MSLENIITFSLLIPTAETSDFGSLMVQMSFYIFLSFPEVFHNLHKSSWGSPVWPAASTSKGSWPKRKCSQFLYAPGKWIPRRQVLRIELFWNFPIIFFWHQTTFFWDQNIEWSYISLLTGKLSVREIHFSHIHVAREPPSPTAHLWLDYEAIM